MLVKCKGCEAQFFGDRVYCANCGATELEPVTEDPALPEIPVHEDSWNPVNLDDGDECV